MNKYIVFTICGYLLHSCIIAQNTGIDALLSKIEQNNTELKAQRSFIKSQQLEIKSLNNLPDPQFSAYFLPFGTNNTSNYSEFQISQSIEFPTVYLARGKWNNLLFNQLEIEYLKIRQEILLKATSYIIELVILQQQKIIEVTRRDLSEKVYLQLQELFNKEQIGILDLNKAKISWIQKQFNVEELQTKILSIQTSLQKLNGGLVLETSQQTLEESLSIEELEIIWQSKLVRDPILKELKATETSNLQQIKVERNKALPNITAGYNYQGVNGSNYAGFYGGISIPLWNSKSKIKKAVANYEYGKFNAKVVESTEYTNFKKLYNRYVLLLKKYNEYEKTLNSLNGENLLFKAYKLGELSFMDYYVELQFYQKAIDQKLQTKKELFQIKATLLKHQL